MSSYRQNNKSLLLSKYSLLIIYYNMNELKTFYISCQRYSIVLWQLMQLSETESLE